MKMPAACIALLWPGFLLAQMEAKINAPDGAAADNFGHSVAVSGNTMIVGSPFNNVGPYNDCGNAYIYRFNGSSWVHEQILTPLDADNGDLFGYSVAISGNVVLIGAPFDDDLGANSGAAYLFRYNGSTWVQEYKLIPSDGNAGDEYGHSVSLSDTLAVVGAYRSNQGNPGNGAVYVHRYNGITWNQTQKLLASAPQIDDFFGYSVSVHRNRIMVGCYQDDDFGVNSGSAYVFRADNGNWVLEQKLLPTTGAGGDHFGFSVCINDTIAIAGAYSRSTTATASGSAYVFRRTGTTWTQEQQLFPADAMSEDWFGFSVFVSGKNIVCGAHKTDDLGAESGSAYLFSYNGTSWLEEIKLQASDGATGDQFGFFAGMSGNTIAVGSPLNDDNGSASGSVYVYNLCQFRPIQELCMVTVDQDFASNLLLWEKPSTALIEKYSIYRDAGAGMQWLADVGYNQFSEYVDAAVYVNAQAYSYQLTTTNHCGQESAHGITHRTMHLQAGYGSPTQVNLNWTAQQGILFPFYRIWRDTTLSGGNFVLIFATLNTQFVFTDNNLSAGSPARYYLEIQKNAPSCSSGNTTRSSAFSNIADPSITSIAETVNLTVRSWPNPANESLFIELPESSLSGLIQIEIVDLSGRKLISQTTANSRTELNITGLPNGNYILRITHEKQTASARLVVIR